MSDERRHLESLIADLEAQRELLGDAVVDAALAPLRSRRVSLGERRAAGAAEQALKQVTVLFLDVVGSTALAQRLDPEDIHAILDGLLARCTGIVESHQGRVLQYAGDNLLAVFGADRSREDDAERAVHAGLALLAEGRAQAERVGREHGHGGFDVRVGLHTGRVLLGGGVDAEHSIRGNTVNIAARMEQTAPAGALRISHGTYGHVRGVFDVEVQAPIIGKGVDEPITSYLVQRAKARAFRVATRGIEGVETRMVGRDAELEQLQDAFRRLYVEARFQFVTVVGEAGLGKSRLLYEFENWAEARPEPFVVFQGRAQPQTMGQPYGLLRDLLAWRLQIADTATQELAKVKIEQGIAAFFGAGAEQALTHAHLLGHLIGLDFSDSPHIKGIRDDAADRRRRQALRWRLIAARERTFDLLGNRAAQQADITALEQLADDLDDDPRRGEAAWRRSDFAMRTGDYRTQERSARRALMLAQRSGDEPHALRAKLRLALAVSFLGDAAQGKTLGLDGLAKARALGLRAIESLFLNALSVIAGIQDDTMMSLEMDQQRLMLDRELGNPRNEAISLGNLGSEWLSLGDFAQARIHLEEGLLLTRSVGDRGGEATLLGNLSQLALRQGDDTLALAQARLAVETAQAVRDPTGEAYALCRLGNAELGLGRHAQAAAAFERARAVASRIHDGQRFDAGAGLARTALAEGDLDRALEAVDALLAHLASANRFEGAEQSRQILLTCYRVLQRVGDPRAAEVLGLAHAELQAKAAAIDNLALRDSFLNNLREHSDIIAAWAEQPAAAAGRI